MSPKTAAEPAAPFIRPAPIRLAQLAAEMRGWDYEEIRAGLIACSTAGWTDERIYREMFRLLLLEDAAPADLRVMARDWTKRLSVADGPDGSPQNPETAALLRQAVENANAATAAQQARERNPGNAA